MSTFHKASPQPHETKVEPCKKPQNGPRYCRTTKVVQFNGCCGEDWWMWRLFCFQVEQREPCFATLACDSRPRDFSFVFLPPLVPSFCLFPKPRPVDVLCFPLTLLFAWLSPILFGLSKDFSANAGVRSCLCWNFCMFHGLKKSHLLGACLIHSCQQMDIKFHDELNETVGRVDSVCQELSRTLDDEDFASRSTVQS